MIRTVIDTMCLVKTLKYKIRNMKRSQLIKKQKRQIKILTQNRFQEFIKSHYKKETETKKEER